MDKLPDTLQGMSLGTFSETLEITNFQLRDFLVVLVDLAENPNFEKRTLSIPSASELKKLTVELNRQRSCNIRKAKKTPLEAVICGWNEHADQVFSDKDTSRRNLRKESMLNFIQGLIILGQLNFVEKNVNRYQEVLAFTYTSEQLEMKLV